MITPIMPLSLSFNRAPIKSNNTNKRRSGLSNFPMHYISFKGNIDSFVNYRNNFEAIKISQKEQLSGVIDKNISPNDFAKKSINKIFKLDREILNYNYLDDINSFDKFSKLGYIEDQIKYNSGFSNYIEQINERKLSKEYEMFFNDTLKSLESVSKGEHKYTDMFLDKQIGSQNLVDFWLKKLNKNKEAEDKIELLNNSLNEEYRKNGNINNLAKETILEFFRNKMLPEQKKTENKNTISNYIALNNIKEQLSDISLCNEKQQKVLFNDLVANKYFMNEKIDGKKVQDLLLGTLFMENESVIDASDDLKQTFLQEIAEDNVLRKSAIDTTLSVLRKNLILTKAKEEKYKLVESFVENDALENFDKNLIKKLFIQNTKEKTDTIIQDIKLFEKESSLLFKQMIVQEPFTTKGNNKNINESLNIIFTLINKRISTTTSSKEANSILDKLSDLSKTLYVDKDMGKANNIWVDLNRVAYTEWKEKHIPYLIKSKQEDYIAVEEFLKNPMPLDLKETGIIGTVFNSDIINIEEKAFLAKKSSSNEFVSLCKFLSEHVPGNNERKKIIDNLIGKEDLHRDIFDEIKNSIIVDIREQKTDSLSLSRKIKINNVEKSFCDLIIEQFPNKENVNQFSDVEKKLHFLNKLTDEDLSTAFNNLKPTYLKDSFMDAFQVEVIKYDLGSQIDSVMKNLQIEFDGKKINLFDFIDADFGILEKKIEKNNDLTQAKLDETLKGLFINNKDTKQIHQILTAIFDRMEESNSHNQFVSQISSDAEKLCTGITKGIGNSAGSFILAIATENWYYLATAIVPLLSSVNQEFKKGVR